MKRMPIKDDIFKRIFAGLAWPGKRPGFCCVLGEREPHPGVYHFHLLAEDEDEDMLGLVRKAADYDFYYTVDRWLSDTENQAGWEFIWQLNESFRTKEALIEGRRNLNLYAAPLLSSSSMFQYLFSAIKKHGEKKRLHLGKNSKLFSYLAQVQGDQIGNIRLGNWPAIEALGWPLIELEKTQPRLNQGPRQETTGMDYDPLTF